MKRLAMVASTATMLMIAGAAIAQDKPKPPKSPRLYVFDCGSLTMSAPATFGSLSDLYESSFVRILVRLGFKFGRLT